MVLAAPFPLASANGERENFASDHYAAEALATDMDPWIIFDCRKTPKSEFDAWLESNRPSQVRRFGDEKSGVGPVGWISVRGPSDQSSDKDLEGLWESWEKLLASGRPVTFQTVKELALNHRVLSGKWLMHLDSGFKLDHAWECVARAIVEGKIWCAKVSPFDPTGGDSRHVICVYNRDFTDEEDVMRLDSVIRSTGIKCPLFYKPDVYTYLGIYRRNRWELSPTIYESRFDLECVPRRSHIFNKVTNLERT
uniref:Chromosome 11 open reading frame 68 n=1 Tax=Oryzias latipes TaxID=8090 RepID=A0A3P9I1P0_ORYLA